MISNKPKTKLILCWVYSHLLSPYKKVLRFIKRIRYRFDNRHSPGLFFSFPNLTFFHFSRYPDTLAKMAAHSSCNFALTNPIISQIDSFSKKKLSVPLYFFSTRKALTNPWLGVVDSSLSLTSPVSALQTNRPRRIHKSAISSLPTA